MYIYIFLFSELDIFQHINRLHSQPGHHHPAPAGIPKGDHQCRRGAARDHVETAGGKASFKECILCKHFIHSGYPPNILSPLTSIYEEDHELNIFVIQGYLLTTSPLYSFTVDWENLQGPKLMNLSWSLLRHILWKRMRSTLIEILTCLTQFLTSTGKLTLL